MLRQDLSFAFRQFRKSPGFAITAIVSLMLGIGATTAVFSVVYAVLMNPYPYKDSARLGYPRIRDKTGANRWMGLSARQFDQLKQLSCFESVAAFSGWSLTTTDSDLPEDVEAIYLTPNVTTMLGVPALLGRPLLASDAPEGRDPEPIVVLSYKFWQRYYNGRTDILGKTLRLVHKPYTIVGVMPQRFTWQGGDVYLPLRLEETKGPNYGSVIKLRPGITKAAAEAQMQPLWSNSPSKPGAFSAGFRVHIAGLNDWVQRNIGEARLGCCSPAWLRCC